jgi:hypothetical protein
VRPIAVKDIGRQSNEVSLTGCASSPKSIIPVRRSESVEQYKPLKPISAKLDESTEYMEHEQLFQQRSRKPNVGGGLASDCFSSSTFCLRGVIPIVGLVKSVYLDK